ncbi:hypothetical protein HYZ06_01820 [Candidatus Daviesbacteria bacterium]|nr:hypothetical protein [Candidatus Daviesbacteria bacterium]
MSKPKINTNINIPDDILRSLLTSSEMRMLKNRYRIRNLLQEGLTVRKVAEKVNVGTDTVIRVAKMMEQRPPKKVIRTQTPWIFGKAT